MGEKRAKMVELETGLLAAFEAKCKANGTTFRFELEDAMRRHLAYPPKREPEPFAPPAEEEKPKGKKK
ncbi:MAG TPA: hypothetical protein VD866_08810 [Urbifossiella sp.]|nr:hypothetical protein [Urbifossiella sp.]